jgi:hypothetical protein
LATLRYTQQTKEDFTLTVQNLLLLLNSGGEHSPRSKLKKKLLLIPFPECRCRTYLTGFREMNDVIAEEEEVR